jgi:aminoglycoside/choline kinase family phosphotransferase
VHHFDLYRLGDPSELDELGFEEAIDGGAALVEWPERASGQLPAATLTIDLQHEGAGRTARLTGPDSVVERFARSLAMRDFLVRAGWGEAARRRFVGDASARSYEIVRLDGEPPRVLMNAPPLVLGPPVRGDRAYAEIAHTSRDITAFVAIDKVLAKAGVTVPEIYADDLGHGFALMEHLGSGSFLDAERRPVRARYAAAAELLAFMHAQRWSYDMEVRPSVRHVVPAFDRDAMMIEAELLVDWYVPVVTAAPASEMLRATFRRKWDALIDRLAGSETTLMLRDFHSPNIVWRDDRAGFDRLGILDFQDALIGPPAYDVASLAMDARVTVPEAIEQATLAAYIAARKEVGAFDEDHFREAYAIMAAQRNSKILGIFVRLDRRDGKPAYLKHLPRIRAYLRRAVAHPALAGLRAFYEEHGILEERVL